MYKRQALIMTVAVVDIVSFIEIAGMTVMVLRILELSYLIKPKNLKLRLNLRKGQEVKWSRLHGVSAQQ